MPSFDIVSKTDIAEVDNAINGAMRKYLHDTISKIVNPQLKEKLMRYI